MHKVSPRADLAQCTDSILVCALQFDGRGDIYGAHEIALRVQRLMPQAKVVFTILKPHFSEMETFLFSSKEIVDISEIQKQEQWVIEEESLALQSISTFKKIIVFPTYHDSLLPEEILNRKNDVIKLREYSVCAPKPGTVAGQTYTLGLNLAQGEKGVLLPEEWAGIIPLCNSQTAEQRLDHLKRVNPALSKAILGTDFSEKAVQLFSQGSKLHLGYYSQPDVFFCFINALLATKNKNLVILSTQKRPPELMDNIEQALCDNGFVKINLIEFTDSNRFVTSGQQISQTGNKTCTLIFRTLSATEMDAILRASEEEALTTGDLSPFKFMAYRKVIIYDTRTQKHESAEAMVQLAAQCDLRFKKFLSLAFFGAEHPGQTVNVIELENGMAKWIKAMEEDSSLKEGWNKFIDEVFSKYDFTPHLAEIVKERMTESQINNE